MFDLSKARNVNLKEVRHMEEYGGFVEIYTIEEPSATVWNAKAEKINTKTFIKAHGREPKNYNEVLNWINSLINYENQKRCS